MGCGDCLPDGLQVIDDRRAEFITGVNDDFARQPTAS